MAGSVRSQRRAALVALIALFFVSTSAEATRFWRKPKIQRGTPVEMTGVVTDALGDPIPKVRVVLEATRNRFQVRELRRTEVDSFKVNATTNERGEYRIPWKWNDYYNGFELMVATPVRQRGGKTILRVLARTDISDKVKGGGPIIAPMVVEDTTFLYTLRRFLASVDSKDEIDVYDRMGRPDKVESFPTQESEEVTWWYFEAGELYRFRDGELDKVEKFEPVEKF